jgi:hypothetical protein
MDIKDLAGLSEPLKKLIEVTAEGIGAVIHPLLVKRNTDAKAYEIRTIAQAIVDSQKLLGAVKYEEGGIVVESAPSQELLPSPESDIENRILMRVAYQQAKKQSNIESVVQYAADDLKSEKEVAQEMPDSDWVTRFFNISEDVSSDQMQILWGKILAGEIKKPGSYSLRTLDVLKNITQQEAELFVRVCKIAFYCSGIVFIPKLEGEIYLKEKFGLSFADFLFLQEIGLLAPGENLGFTVETAEENTQAIFLTGTSCVVVYRPKGTPRQNIDAIFFTEIGKQLYQVIEQSPADAGYIERFARLWRGENIETKSGLALGKKNGLIMHSTLVKVPV